MTKGLTSSSAEKVFQNEPKDTLPVTWQLFRSFFMYVESSTLDETKLTSCQGYHVQITARSDRDLTPDGIVQKVADASGAKYSAGTGTSAGPSAGPTPPVASKPAFTPTRSTGGSSFNPLASSRSRQTGTNDNGVDGDGWGADAPPVTRTQLEKVQPAYQPTKVNMAELTKQKPEPSRFGGASQTAPAADSENVVKGGYQPVGKVDIAAIRAQAQKRTDDRPEIVKGAYEPVGKIDIAAIRARAQKPADEQPPRISPAATGEDSAPKSLAERSAAFSQSERLASLPKPKVANKFGSTVSTFTGTKAPTPGVFGLQSAPAVASPAPVGAASRTFADEGGKTPAQIWAEKKARERGLSGAGNTSVPATASPITSQTSGGGEWKSGYSGKSWAPVATTATGRSGTSSVGEQKTGDQDREEEDSSSAAGGIAALKNKFSGAAPMGAPTTQKSTSADHDAPPLDISSKPTGIPLPGLPARPRLEPEEEDVEENAHPNIPPPPRVQRSPTPPTPEREESPVRIAMPVSRSKVPELEPPEERLSAPPMPIRSLQQAVPDEEELTEEPTGHDPAREAGRAVAEASFSDAAPATSGSGGKRALVQYDYEKAEENEIDLMEGEYVTEIDQVDESWWAGVNSKGEHGLFPSNYVELVEEEEQAPPQPARHMAPAPAAAPVHEPEPEPESITQQSHSKSAGPTATALYDYEAAEDNELSFAEGEKITGLVS